MAKGAKEMERKKICDRGRDREKEEMEGRKKERKTGLLSQLGGKFCYSV